MAYSYRRRGVRRAGFGMRRRAWLEVVSSMETKATLWFAQNARSVETLLKGERLKLCFFFFLQGMRCLLLKRCSASQGGWSVNRSSLIP